MEHRLLLGLAYQDQGIVFASPTGGPFDAGALRRAFAKLIRSAGIKQIRFHDLRHTCATLLLSAGVHPKVVSERLGHSKVSFTPDTYSHVLPNMQKEAALAMESLLTKAAAKSG